MISQESAIWLSHNIIRDYFPEITNTLPVKFVHKKGYYMSVRRLLGCRELLIDETVLALSDMAFIGCLVYELSHRAHLKHASFGKRVKWRMMATTIDEERAAGKFAAVNKGFGMYLSRFLQESKKYGRCNQTYEGLTQKELRKLTKHYFK